MSASHSCVSKKCSLPMDEESIFILHFAFYSTSSLHVLFKLFTRLIDIHQAKRSTRRKERQGKSASKIV